MTDQQLLVQVRCAWNAWRTADVRIGDLHDVHWRQPAGAPRPLLHAYVECTNVADGDIPHEHTATPAPHRLLVCVLKRTTMGPAYGELVRLADTPQTELAAAPR